MAPHNRERLAPEFLVRVAGTELPPRAVADILHVSVHEDVDLPAMFTVDVLNWDQDRAALTWSDMETFKEGKEIEIRVGYRDHLEKLLLGEITALEISVAAGGAPTLTVQGYDRSHRLMRCQRVRAFSDVTDSDIARRVAEDAGLTADITATRERHAYVLQCNQTDLEFLRQRAHRIGYEVMIHDRTLTFRPRRISGQPTVLTREADLLEFRSRVTTLAPASRAEVRGWDPATKRAVVGRAEARDAAAAMGGSTHAVSAVAQAFGASDARLVTSVPMSQGEADNMARAAIDEAALRYIEAEGMCMGRADVRAGAVIRLEGLGERFSGPYYVTAATHSYLPSRGYRTRFTARRNAT